MNPVTECILNHKSVRKYKNQPIEDEKLKTIIQSVTRTLLAELSISTFSASFLEIITGLLTNSKLSFTSTWGWFIFHRVDLEYFLNIKLVLMYLL